MLTFNSYFFLLFDTSNSYFSIISRKHTVSSLSTFITPYFRKQNLGTRFLFMLNQSVCHFISTPNSHVTGSNLNHFFNISSYITSFLFNFKYLFSFYCEKMNKRLYKFSKYKVDRVSLKLYYVKPFNRVKHTLFQLYKTILLLPQSTLTKRLFVFAFNFIFHKNSLNFLRTTQSAHLLTFQKYQSSLFISNRSV
jgi:hypothetical protein